MGRRRRRTAERHERVIEHRQWFTEQVGDSFNPADNSNEQLFTLDSMTLKSDDCTILRTRGKVHVYVDHLSDASQPIQMVLGACVLPAKYAGETSNLPNPLKQNESDDWFLWVPASIVHVQAVTSGSGVVAIYEFDIDSKAMRKMQAVDVVKPIVGVASDPTAFGSDDRIFIGGVFRILVGY